MTIAHASRSVARTTSKLAVHSATQPDLAGANQGAKAGCVRQVWFWDMTYLPAQGIGRRFYLDLFLAWVAARVGGFTGEAGDNSGCVQRTALVERSHSLASKAALHGRQNGDNSESRHRARDSEFPGDQTIRLTTMRIRRQGLCRSAFRHREVRAGVLRSGSRESHTGTVLGERLRPLTRHGTYAIVIFAMTRPSSALPATIARCWRPAIRLRARNLARGSRDIRNWSPIATVAAPSTTSTNMPLAA
jgi:hypothetical protein